MGYTLPLSSDSLYIDAVTGDLIWDTPVDTGIYNIAIEIEEWRRGAKIGSIARDMQIEVFKTDNQPPVIMPLRDFCVEAGELIKYDIISTDPDAIHLVNFLHPTCEEVESEAESICTNYNATVNRCIVSNVHIMVEGNV